MCQGGAGLGTQGGLAVCQHALARWRSRYLAEAAVDADRASKVEGIDNWTIYRALSDPLEGLGGRPAVDVVTDGSIDDVAKAVFNVLGFH